MKHIPILYSTAMVQAKLAGKKTQTRRLRALVEINESPNDWEFVRLFHGWAKFWEKHNPPNERHIRCPYGQPGDILWGRETSANLNIDSIGVPPFYVYLADLEPSNNYGPITWKPSIHMPKTACRLFDKVVSIRVERLQDISEADAIAEGIISQNWEETNSTRYKDYMADASGYGHPEHDFPTVSTAIESYKTLWEKINGPGSWEQNPWVWVIETEAIAKPENWPA